MVLNSFIKNWFITKSNDRMSEAFNGHTTKLIHWCSRPVLQCNLFWRCSTNFSKKCTSSPVKVPFRDWPPERSSDWAQYWYTTQHRTVMTIFRFIFQSITNASNQEHQWLSLLHYCVVLQSSGPGFDFCQHSGWNQNCTHVPEMCPKGERDTTLDVSTSSKCKAKVPYSWVQREGRGGWEEVKSQSVHVSHIPSDRLALLFTRPNGYFPSHSASLHFNYKSKKSKQYTDEFIQCFISLKRLHMAGV